MIQVECDIDISFVVVDSIVIYCIVFFYQLCFSEQPLRWTQKKYLNEVWELCDLWVEPYKYMFMYVWFCVNLLKQY